MCSPELTLCFIDNILNIMIIYCHMDNSLDKTSRNLGHNIVSLRKKRGLSQFQLAKRSDLPRSTISNFESGIGNPSLQNLVKLSSALQISIEELLSSPRSECLLIKSENIPVQSRQNGQAHIYKLLPDKISGAEIDRIELAIGGRMGGVPHLDGTKEYFICEQGEIQLAVSGQKFQLKPGDVLSFRGDQPHSYSNNSKVKAIGYSIVFVTPSGF